MDIGDKFPEYSLSDENDETVNSKDLNGVRYIIYFYPRNNTAGCTKEALEFTELISSFLMRNVPVFGVSRDPPASHRKFIDKHGLKVKLLSDPDHTLTEAVGAWGMKKMYGREYEGVFRSTFIVGKDGRVEAVWKNVRVAGHAQKVLDRVISLIKS